MVAPQPNTVGDLAGVLRHASDVLTRISEIDKTIRDLQDEKNALLIEIGTTWGTRVNDMQKQLIQFVQYTQSPAVQVNAPLDFSRIDKAVQELDNINPDLPEGDSDVSS
jgi:hypothetical protein